MTFSRHSMSFEGDYTHAEKIGANPAVNGNGRA